MAADKKTAFDYNMFFGNYSPVIGLDGIGDFGSGLW